MKKVEPRKKAKPTLTMVKVNVKQVEAKAGCHCSN